MVEVVISTLLVAMLTIVSLDSVGSALKANRIAGDQLDANLLAASLMAEILAQPYEDPDDTAVVVFGIEADEPHTPFNRAEFDDVDDYHLWSSTPTTRGGEVVPGTSGWTRSVAVNKLNWQSPGTQIGAGQADQGVRRVTVTVTDDEGNKTVLAALCSCVGQNRQAIGVDATLVTAVNIACTVGGLEHEVSASVGNHGLGP